MDRQFHQSNLERKKELLEKKLSSALQSVSYLHEELQKLNLKIENFMDKKSQPERNYKVEYLNKHIFKDLVNLNNGFDSPVISYFSESDFEVVLNRIKEKGIGVYGIEVWLDNQYYDIDTFENYQSVPQQSWYITAFEKFKATGLNLMYSASYYVPGNFYEL